MFVAPSKPLATALDTPVVYPTFGILYDLAQKVRVRDVRYDTALSRSGMSEI